MRRGLVVVVVVLAVGYSLYGALFVAAGAVHHAFAQESLGATDAEAGNATAPARPFAFEAAEVGLNYTYLNEERGGHAEMMTNAGLYAGDYDGDRWTDLLAVGGERPILYENRGGSFRPSGALPPIDRKVRAATFLDYDRDGRLDLLLLSANDPPLLLENVGGRYEKRAAFERPLDRPFGAAVADYDRDGCPDLFVYQNGNWSERVPRGFLNYSVPANADNGNPDVLYRGTCEGFDRVEGAGIEGARWTLATSFVDLTDDGYPDIHTANDINHDVVYLNQRNGTFEQVVLPERTNRNGMSSEVADVTGDGRLDVFVTNIYYPEWAAERINAGLVTKAHGNNLVANHGDGVFVERARQYGVSAGGWGWAAVLADFDNDGDEDLFHTTRYMDFERRDTTFTDDEIRRLRSKPYFEHPAVWSRTNVTTFRRVGAEQSGFESANGRGVVRLDYDRDGDLDLAVAATGAYRVYENRMDRGRAVQVRVLGANGGGTGAYGATVTVTAGGENATRRVHGRSDYLSQDSRLVHVGVGDADRVDVRVTWPDGTTRTVEGVPVGTRLVVGPDGVRARIGLDDG
jgi:hypothetical protein